MSRVLLIAVEGWLPNGSDAAALAGIFSAPPVAIPLIKAPAAVHWVSLATGSWPQEHGVLSERAPGAGGEGWRPVAAGDRERAAIWEVGATLGVTSVVTGWPAMQGARSNHSALWIADGFGSGGYLPGDFVDVDGNGVVAKLGEVAVLRECWMGPEEVPVEMIALIKPDWERVDQDRDRILVELGLPLAESISLNAAFLEGLETRMPRFAALRLPLMAKLEAVRRRRVEERGDGAVRVEAVRPLVLQAIQEAVRRMSPETCVVVVGLSASGEGVTDEKMEARVWVRNPQAAEALRFGGGSLVGVGRWIAKKLGVEIPAVALEGSGGVVPSLARRINEMEGAGAETSLISEKERAAHWEEVFAAEGRFRVVVGDFGGALGVIEELVRIVPERVSYHVWKSRMEETLGLVAEALDSAEIASALAPEDPLVWLRVLELQVNSGDLAGATVRLGQRPKRIGERLEWLVGLGRVLCHFRRWDEALEMIQRERARFPGEALADLGESMAWVGKGEWLRAEEAAARYREKCPKVWEGHYYLGLALMGRGEWSAALTALEAALALNPNAAMVRRAWILARRRLGVSEEVLAPHEEALARGVERAGELVRAVREEVTKRRSAVGEESEASEATEGELGMAARVGKVSAEALRLTLLVGVAGSRYCDLARALAAGGCPVEMPTGAAGDLGRESVWWSHGDAILKNLGKRLEGRVLPMAVHQFYRLPRLHSYRILFFRCRVTDAVVRAWSEDRLASMHGGGKALAMADAAELMRRSQDQAGWLMTQMPNVDVMVWDAARWVRSPDLVLREVSKFLGEGYRFDEGAALKEGSRFARENQTRALW